MISFRHWWGETELVESASRDDLRTLLSELKKSDGEHGSVGVTHRQLKWSVSAGGNGLLDASGPEYRNPQHSLMMTGVGDEEILDVWEELARGDLASMLARPWRPAPF